ncbi:hypothetical protein NPIL_423421 [Nephila pilipes]|uniref:Uncharacterized protein n=1 Tax=Nephila pilipes TaxID=299642 RepID=A0A8X6QUU7_NEPPI|nr:hypothetical protein NPIL_423421 [Nephila pilipes]
MRIKCSSELQEVKTQIQKTEARILNLQVKEVLYQRKSVRRVMLRKEEELKQLAQSEKKKCKGGRWRINVKHCLKMRVEVNTCGREWNFTIREENSLWPSGLGNNDRAEKKNTNLQGHLFYFCGRVYAAQEVPSSTMKRKDGIWSAAASPNQGKEIYSLWIAQNRHELSLRPSCEKGTARKRCGDFVAVSPTVDKLKSSKVWIPVNAEPPLAAKRESDSSQWTASHETFNPVSPHQDATGGFC